MPKKLVVPSSTRLLQLAGVDHCPRAIRAQEEQQQSQPPAPSSNAPAELLKSLQQSNLLSVQLPLLAMASWLRETQKASTRSVVGESEEEEEEKEGRKEFWTAHTERVAGKAG